MIRLYYMDILMAMDLQARVYREIPSKTLRQCFLAIGYQGAPSLLVSAT